MTRLCCQKGKKKLDNDELANAFRVPFCLFCGLTRSFSFSLAFPLSPVAFSLVLCASDFRIAWMKDEMKDFGGLKVRFKSLVDV